MLNSLFSKLNFLKSYKNYFIAIVFLFFSVIIIKFFYIFLSSNSVFFDDTSINRDSRFHFPKDLNFADEKTPQNDSSIIKNLENEFSNFTLSESQTFLLNKRAHRWFPIIEPILKQNNIPDDFKYIAVIESQLTNVTSHQGAAGFWQFVESTAKSYGLEITDDIDQRYDITKSTEAACNYFNEAYKQFNNWTLVAASYNLGMAGIQTQLDKQKVNNYYQLKLPNETESYIFRLLAVKEILTRSSVYGFHVCKKDFHPIISTKRVKIDSTIHNLVDFAAKQGIDYRVIKLFNPWLISTKIFNPEKKKYFIEIPKGKINISDWEENYFSNDFSKLNDSANLNKSILLKSDSSSVK